MRVLIVDDEPLVSAFLVRVVGLIDNIAGMVASGEEAIIAYRETTPDLVLMDNSMPGMTGLEALVEIRAEFPDAKIAICSSDEVEEEAMGAGAVAYLRKPFRLQSVKEILRRFDTK